MESLKNNESLHENVEQENCHNDIKIESNISDSGEFLNETEEQLRKRNKVREIINKAVFKPFETKEDILETFKAFKSELEVYEALEAEIEEENEYYRAFEEEEKDFKAEEELEAVMETKECFKNSYTVRVGLRNKFKNSYFLEEIYDDAICGLNPASESVIYDFTKLDSLNKYLGNTASFNVSNNIWRCVQEINKLENLKSEELGGKVKPTFIFWLQNMKQWPVMVEKITESRELPF